jgi:SAM-dependent methyltransferase
MLQIYSDQANGSDKRLCPLCSNLRCVDRGPILHPDAPMVAGVPIYLTGLTFRLLRCDSCHFQFKYPALPPDMVRDCYIKSKDDHWGAPDIGVGREFGVISKLLERYAPNRTILDIGCNNGAFLMTLGNQWRRFGVEPSKKAADLAAIRNIKVLGDTLFDVAPSGHKFDAITAIDVMEHLSDPLPLLTRAKELLQPQGVLLIQTGDSAALPWRLQGSRHWYCSLPEHVSFFCERTLNCVGQQLGMKRLDYRRICHRRTDLTLRMTETAKNLGYVLGNRLNGFGLSKLQAVFVHRRAPVWLSARDHMVYVFQNQ